MLKLAEDLTLPIDTVTQSMAILARRGAGKTYTGSVLAEEVIKAGVPVVMLDPTGAWWGLRSSADGKRAGLPVTIFGGDHGDLALEATAGALFAEVVLEHPGAYIFDFSAFTSKTAEQTFAATFLEHLYRGKKADTGPLLVIVDEADMFAPQRPGPEQTKSLGALESIVRRGRIKGLGCLLITQRAAVLNKNVLTQTEILIVMQTTGPQDRAAIKEWIAGNSTGEVDEVEVLSSLASLAQGQAWVWSPSFLKMLRLVRIRKRTTFDSSNTPGAGKQRIEPVAFAQPDLDRLGERVVAMQQKQVENDPRRLQARVRELERDLEVSMSIEHVHEKIVEVPVLTAEEKQIVEQLVEVLKASTEEVRVALARATSPLNELRRTAPGNGANNVVAEKVVEIRRLPDSAHDGFNQLVAAASSDLKLGKAERTFLSALAQYPQGLSRRRLSLMTGYSEDSGHTKNTLGKLRGVEYITRGEPVMITDAGRAALGPYEPLPEPGPHLVAYWMGRLGLAERRMLDVFVRVYPMGTTKQAISNETGYSYDSGHFKNTLGRLRGLGLVDGWAASQELMG
jgi:hypothetical protein